MSLPVRVIKVGGSLFDLDRFPSLLSAWLDRQRPAGCVFVAGGGPFVDEIRRLDERFRIGERDCHWMCVSIMSITAALVARLLDGPTVCRLGTVRDFDDLRSRLAEKPPPCLFFDGEEFLRDVEPHLPGVKLTDDWRTSSDSIAARLAFLLGADELVLLKSTGLTAPPTVAAAVEQRKVDDWFPHVARGLTCIRWVNLRDGRESRLIA